MGTLLQAFLSVLMHSFLPFRLLLLVYRFIMHLALEMLAVVQITDVIIQQFNEIAICLVFLQICGDGFSKIALNGYYSFLGLFVG